MEANYIVSEDNIRIEDSAFISKKEFKPILKEIASEYPTNQVVKDRFYYSAITEWTTHNFLYNIGYKREHTKDVDINVSLK